MPWRKFENPQEKPLHSTEILGALSLVILNLAKGLSQVSKENRRKPKHTQRKKPRGERERRAAKSVAESRYK